MSKEWDRTVVIVVCNHKPGAESERIRTVAEHVAEDADARAAS